MLILQAIASVFRRESLEQIYRKGLYEARRDLYDAELTAERAAAELAMLRARVGRMEAGAPRLVARAADDPAQPVHLDIRLRSHTRGSA